MLKDELKVVEIRLTPDQLSGDACDAFALSLAHALTAMSSPLRAPEIPETWRRRAIEMVEAGTLPLPPLFPLAVQVENLTRALAAGGYQIRILCEEIPQHLARAIEWLKSHSAIPVTMAGGAGRFAKGADYGDRAITEITLPDRVAAEGCLVASFALAGHPHPASPGEERLFRRLNAEPDLAQQFECNARVVSKHGRSYWADLLHRDARLIVEVDGFTFHRSRESFFSDRHRDYELLVSGYQTLRLDHDEILRDIESAVGKIRDVLHYLSGQLKS